MRAPITALATAAVLGAAAVGMQPVARVAATAQVLVALPVFYHGKPVVVQHEVVNDRGLPRLADTAKPVYVFWKHLPGSDEGEIRGEFWDLGRLEPDDSRFAAYNFADLIQTVAQGRWPGRDQIFVLLGAEMVPAFTPPAPTVRAIVLTPERYEQREVRVIGRFKGRNLYGELPQALGRSKWDFVLQSAEGALWVTGMRPRGKGFDLDPGARVDTGRWLEVTGVVERLGHLVYIEASAIRQTAAPTEVAAEVVLPERPRLPPPEVIFSAPVQEDVDIERSATVRIQFSRDVDAKTLAGKFRVSYIHPEGGSAGEAPKVPPFSVAYNDAAHAVEIRFKEPLPRFTQVRVEILEGIMALDGQPVKPWTLTFTTGAQ